MLTWTCKLTASAAFFLLSLYSKGVRVTWRFPPPSLPLSLARASSPFRSPEDDEAFSQDWRPPKRATRRSWAAQQLGLSAQPVGAGKGGGKKNTSRPAFNTGRRERSGAKSRRPSRGCEPPTPGPLNFAGGRPRRRWRRFERRDGTVRSRCRGGALGGLKTWSFLGQDWRDESGGSFWRLTETQSPDGPLSFSSRLSPVPLSTLLTFSVSLGTPLSLSAWLVGLSTLLFFPRPFSCSWRTPVGQLLKTVVGSRLLSSIPFNFPALPIVLSLSLKSSLSLFLAIMPWPFSESIKKRACRYLLQRYLGHFLQEKLSLEQLTLDLYQGTGCLAQVPLDKWVSDLVPAGKWGIVLWQVYPVCCFSFLPIFWLMFWLLFPGQNIGERCIEAVGCNPSSIDVKTDLPVSNVSFPNIWIIIQELISLLPNWSCRGIEVKIDFLFYTWEGKKGIRKEMENSCLIQVVFSWFT